MNKRAFGKAEYLAIRNGSFVKLIAHGTVPNFNTKTDFEQLPIRIYPPQFGFFFVTPEIELPARRPFTYEEDVPFPKEQDLIIIVDADGERPVKIEDISLPESSFDMPSKSDSGYCVFSIVGRKTGMMIAKCDAIVPAIYSKSFGPATYGECLDYIAHNK